MARRAARLTDTTPTLRAKGAGEAIRLLLDEDDGVGRASNTEAVARRLAPAVRTPGRAWCGARADRPASLPAALRDGRVLIWAGARKQLKISTSSLPTCRPSCACAHCRAPDTALAGIAIVMRDPVNVISKLRDNLSFQVRERFASIESGATYSIRCASCSQ